MIKKITICSFLALSFFLVGCGGSGSKSVSQEKVVDSLQEQQTTSQTIFALGDSLTAGYRIPLEESYPMQLEQLLKRNGYEISVANGGKSGETSSGLVQTVSWITGDAQPGDIAVVTIGGNDGLQSLPVEQLASNLREIVDILLAKEMTIVVGGMQIPTNFNLTYRNDFAALYATVVQEYSENVTLLPFLLEGVAGDNTLNLPDGIHPNKAGYTIVAQTVYDHLLSQGLLE